MMHQIATVSNKVSNKFPKPMDIIGADTGLAISDVTDLSDALSFFVQGFQKIAHNLRHWNLTLGCNFFQLLKLSLIQPHSENFSPCPSHVSIFVLLWYYQYIILDKASKEARCLLRQVLLSLIGLVKMGSPPASHRLGDGHAIHLKTKRNITYEYTKPKGRSPSPSSTVPSYADMGGGVMERNSLADVPQGREGWVYLIHAEGTNRYKIGRSVKPIVRVADIQKQSPYPLKLIYSTWTLDAPFDEAQLHQIFSKYRIFGEWFDFGFDLEKHEMSGTIYSLLTYPPTEHLLAEAGLKSFYNFLGVSGPDAIEGAHLILCLYSFAGSRSQMALIENFVKKTLPKLIQSRGISQADIVDGCVSESLSQFFYGAVLTFEAVVLSGGVQ